MCLQYIYIYNELHILFTSRSQVFFLLRLGQGQKSSQQSAVCRVLQYCRAMAASIIIYLNFLYIQCLCANNKCTQTQSFAVNIYYTNRNDSNGWTVKFRNWCFRRIRAYTRNRVQWKDWQQTCSDILVASDFREEKVLFKISSSVIGLFNKYKIDNVIVQKK